MRTVGWGIIVIAVTMSSSFAEGGLQEDLDRLNSAIRGARSLDEQEPYILRLTSLGERALAEDAYGVAATAFDYASRIARRSRPAEAAAYAARMNEARAMERVYAQVQPFLGKDDATARRKVAEFHAFVKGDWKSALDGLALGDDALAKAAQLERQYLGGEEAEAVADAWLDAAKTRSAHAAAICRHAGVLYDEAAAVVPTTTLLAKMAKLGSRIGSETAAPAGAVRVKHAWYAFSPSRANKSSEAVDKAFDGDMRTRFEGIDGGGWVALDLRTPQIIRRIGYAPHQPSSDQWIELCRNRMIGAQVQVSNRPDFAGAVTVYTITEAPVMGRMTEHAVAVEGVWRYVRYKAPNHDRCAIGEFDVQ